MSTPLSYVPPNEYIASTNAKLFAPAAYAFGYRNTKAVRPLQNIGKKPKLTSREEAELSSHDTFIQCKKEWRIKDV